MKEVFVSEALLQSPRLFLDTVSTVRGSGWVRTRADPSATADGTDCVHRWSL